MAPTSTPLLPAPATTSTAQAVVAFVLAAVTVSNRDVGIGTLLGGGDTEYSESAAVSVHSSNSSSSPVAGAGATLFLDGSATAIDAEAPGAAS